MSKLAGATSNLDETKSSVDKGQRVHGEETKKGKGKKLTSKEEKLHRQRQKQYFVNNEQYKKDHNGRSIPIKKKGK